SSSRSTIASSNGKQHTIPFTVARTLTFSRLFHLPSSAFYSIWSAATFCLHLPDPELIGEFWSRWTGPVKHDDIARSSSSSRYRLSVKARRLGNPQFVPIDKDRFSRFLDVEALVVFALHPWSFLQPFPRRIKH